jgi:hypothetical protein
MDVDQAKREKYYYVGRETELGDKRLDAIGQILTLSRQEHDALISKVPLLSEQEFKSVFDDPIELAKWGHAGRRGLVPPSFEAKIMRAASIVADKRSSR